MKIGPYEKIDNKCRNLWISRVPFPSFHFDTRLSHSRRTIRYQYQNFTLKFSNMQVDRGVDQGVVLWTVNEELDMESFHDERGGFNYATVPGERWGISKLFLHEGRAFTKEKVSQDKLRLYLKCRKHHYPHNPCQARAVIYGEIHLYKAFIL
jgi:hypothetical protein